MAINYSKIGQKIKEARKNKIENGRSWSQDKLADAVNSKKQTISLYEHGSSIPLDKLDEIANALGKDLNWFLADDDQANTPSKIPETVSDVILLVEGLEQALNSQFDARDQHYNYSDDDYENIEVLTIHELVIEIPKTLSKALDTLSTIRRLHHDGQLTDDSYLTLKKGFMETQSQVKIADLLSEYETRPNPPTDLQF